MPPRMVVAAVVAGWLATVGWLAHEKWLPWLRPADEPAFVVEVADEVAPEHFSWAIYRKDKQIGSAETRFAARKDGLFEMTTRLRDLEIEYGSAIHFKMPLFSTTRTVARDGELVSLEAKAILQIRAFGNEIRVDTTIRGHVEEKQFVGECDYDYGGGKFTDRLEPIPLVSKNAFSPLQPGQKYPPLRPGQTWRASNIDPVNDAMSGAVRQIVTRMLNEAFQGKAPFGIPAIRQPTELLARVQDDTEQVTNENKTYTCRVIRFEGDGVKARVWVDVTDGRVVRQEVAGRGESLVLQRE
jgi:hypothetical protein